MIYWVTVKKSLMKKGKKAKCNNRVPCGKTHALSHEVSAFIYILIVCECKSAMCALV